jgi:hypothetical protein
MKRLVLSIVLAVCLASGASAHQGMLALFADTYNRDCHTTLGIGEVGTLYLMYVRDEGPRMGFAFEFRLLKSSSAVAFLTPVWPTSVPPLGTLETGISVTGSQCFPDEDYVQLGTIPIMNIADPDTFTVKVVPDQGMIPPPAVLITACAPSNPIHAVLGGTFVFNAGCDRPEDPYGVIAVKQSTWGAVKELFR